MSEDEQPLLNCTLHSGVVFKHLFTCMKDYLSESNMETVEQGITFEGMDAGKISMVQWKLFRNAFETFEISHPNSFGILLDSILKILNFTSDGDKLHLMALNTGSLDLTSINTKSNPPLRTELTLKLMDLNIDKMEPKEFDFQATVIMPSSELELIFKQLESISDVVEINVTATEMKFTAIGDIGKVSRIFPASVTMEAKRQEDEDEKAVEQQLHQQQQQQQQQPLFMESDPVESSLLTSNATENQLTDENPFLIEGGNNESSSSHEIKVKQEPMSDGEDDSDDSDVESKQRRLRKKRKREEQRQERKKTVTKSTTQSHHKPVAKRYKQTTLPMLSKSGVTTSTTSSIPIYIECKTEYTALFSIRYMKMISRASCLSSQVMLRFIEDQPLFIDYDILNEKQEKIGVLSYFLASRLER